MEFQVHVDNVLKWFISGVICCLLIILGACDKKESLQSEGSIQISEDSLLNLVQYQTFQYFWEGAEPISGMARERIHMDGIYPDDDQNVVTIGGSGFGILAILVGIERGFITREEGLERLNQIVKYLQKADRFHGAWPHWLYGETGKVKPFSKKDDGGDLVETAFMIQGLLAVRQYFKDGSDRERKLALAIDTLWREVDWDWYMNDESVLYWHWSPNFGWEMNFQVEGYNECLIMYILAASSPTHGIPSEAYHEGWARGGDIVSEKTKYGYDLVLKHNHAEEYGGPLFWAHYSYLGLDPRNLEDTYANYWELNRNHAMIQYKYSIDNPKNYKGYGEDCWGLTSSYSMNFYSGHAPGDGDLGVITPTAALSSFPYTPKESMRFLRFLYEFDQNSSNKVIGEYGPYDAFSLEHDWFIERYLAIDQGPIPVMIENHRTGLIWDLFMSAPEIQTGLEKLGFNGSIQP